MSLSPSGRCVIGLLSAAVGLFTAGCGFQLQGATRLSPRMAAVEFVAPDRYSELQQALREALSLAGSRWVAGQGTPTATLRILRDETGRRVLSVSARNTPRELEVYYTVEYRVEADGRELLPRQELTLTRTLSYDETALLAKEQEEEQVRAVLARDLAALITRRLAALP
jgi:LPS-assembly lipoprotein